MAHPYVYKLVHRNTGEYYFGYRAANKLPAEDDLGNVYKSSSAKVAKLGYDNFEYIVVAEFYEADDAYWFEQSLIEDSFNDPLNLNGHFLKADSRAAFKNVKGHTKSDKCKQRMRKPKSKDHAQNIAKARQGMQFSDEHKANIKAAKQKLAKKFRIISPSGEVIIGQNMQDFCTEHNLDRSCMSGVCRGLYKQYKGWTGEYING